MNEVVIYVPCRIFQVRVSVGAGTTMSPLEQHVLRAVAAGQDTVSGLCDVLGVTPRLMIDLLGDLWRAGHVSFDFLDERVSISDEVRDLIKDDELDSLPGAEISDEQRPMMLDTFSGLLSPVGGAYRAGDRNLVPPDHDDEAQLSGIDPAELAEAVARSLNEADDVAGSAATGAAAGRRKRVVRAYLSPASLTMPSEERRFRRVGIRVAINEDGRLLARLAEDTLSGRHHDDAQRRLTRLIESQPASTFVTTLRRAAGGPPQEPETLANTLAELAEQADALRAAPGGERTVRHQEIAAISRRIVRRLAGLAEQEAQARLLAGRDEHETAIRELIGAARTQLVLACPWVDYPGLTTYIEALEAAARRGVQIVLLRGIGRQEVEEDRPVDNALDALKRQAVADDGRPARVLVSPRSSAVIHAKLVVCDDRQAIVTSLNFLQPSQIGTQELGVRVVAPPDRRSPTIQDLLTWSRRAMPDYTVAQTIITDGASFGSLAPPPARPAAEPPPTTADDPPLTAAARDDDEGGAAALAWAGAWSRRAELLAAAAGRQRASVQLLLDGEHRELLWTALRTARHSLLITSDQLAEDVVDQAFVAHVEDCVARGVDVTLIYRRTRREAGALAARRLAALAARPSPGPGRLRIRAERNHAKVLVVDDEAVVTSFNFLSFEGYYGGVGRRRQRSEVGIRIYGGGFAQRLAVALGAAEAEPATLAARLDSRRAISELRALSAAQRVLQRLTADRPVPRGVELVALTGIGDQGLATLAALSSCGTDNALMEPAVAAVLGHGDAAGPSADRWWEWLAQRRFEARDFTVAAALRDLVPGSSAPPRRALLEVAARHGGAELSADLGAAIADAALEEDLTGAEWTALLAAGAHDLLRTGGREVAGAVGIAVAGVDGPWAELGEIVLRWWDEAGRPLPVERIRRGERQGRLAAGADAEWNRLEAALEKFERFNPPFKVGTDTQRFLLRAGGPLSQLTAAARARDRDAVRSWTEDPRLTDVGAYIDAATRAAGSTTLIHGHLRPPIVGRTEEIVAAARALAEHDDVGALRPEPYDETIDAARAAMAALHALLPRLRPALDGIDRPERALAEAALRDLGRLIEGDTPWR